MSSLPASKDLWQPAVFFAVHLDAWFVLASQHIDFKRRAQLIEGKFYLPITLLGTGGKYLYDNERGLNSVWSGRFAIIPVASVASQYDIRAKRRMARDSN